MEQKEGGNLEHEDGVGALSRQIHEELAPHFLHPLLGQLRQKFHLTKWILFQREDA